MEISAMSETEIPVAWNEWGDVHITVVIRDDLKATYLTQYNAMRSAMESPLFKGVMAGMARSMGVDMTGHDDDLVRTSPLLGVLAAVAQAIAVEP
jgi:hypothetical protein